jgi:antirestriction protein ArdC
MKTSATFDIYCVITEKIISKLEAGFIPWQKPWHQQGQAKNYMTKRAYNGINALLLNFQCVENPYYLTFLQAQQLGGRVKKGAKSEMVVLWNYIKDENEKEGEEGKTKAYLKYHNVFNVAVIEGIDFVFPKQAQKPSLDKLVACEEIINNFNNGPTTRFGGSRACYSPWADIVSMPEIKYFSSPEFYYSVFFHELTHSTGHAARLNRKGIATYNAFGSKQYSKEELVAELGAAFLCNVTGIVNHTIDNSAAYIQSWLKKLKSDKKFIVEASSQAFKATQHILGENFSSEQ